MRKKYDLKQVVFFFLPLLFSLGAMAFMGFRAEAKKKEPKKTAPLKVPGVGLMNNNEVPNGFFDSSSSQKSPYACGAVSGRALKLTKKGIGKETEKQKGAKEGK